MKVRKPHINEWSDVPVEDLLHVPSRSMFVPSRNDFYMQAALTGFCANPDYSQHSPEMIARMTMDHASALIRAIDVLNCGELLDDRTYPDTDY